MRIAIYGRGLANKAGIGRYTRALVRSIAHQPRDHQFRLIVGSGVPDPPFEGDQLISLGGTGSRLSEEQIRLPKAIRESGADVYHNPDFTLPLRMPPGIKSVVTIHDVAYLRLPRSNSIRSKLLLNWLVPSSVRRSDAIITVSEFSKKEIVDVYRCNPDKVHVIPNGVDSSFGDQPASAIESVRTKYHLPSERLVLYVGGIEERKNLLRLALAVRKLEHATLAVAGGKNRGGQQIMEQAREVLGDRLLELGFVPDSDLPPLLAAADVFAYPSIYEGFGIPPLEAMACGTVAVVSNAASLPEAVGDAALMFDPYDVDEMSRAIEQALEDDATRTRLIEAGKARAASFTWSSVANQTLDLYESLKPT